MKTLTDDAVLGVASFMDTADMLNVALTCRRFGCSNAAAATDDLSLMEHGARQLIESAPTHEKNWVPYNKGTSNWIGLYHELLKLRAPPSFSSILGNGINYVNKKYHVYASLREQYQQQQLQQAKWLLRRRQYPLTKHSIAPSSSLFLVWLLAITSCRMECTVSNSP